MSEAKEVKTFNKGWDAALRELREKVIKAGVTDATLTVAGLMNTIELMREY